MTQYHTDCDGELDIIEESLREDAYRLLRHFASVTPASVAHNQPSQRSRHFAAQAGLFTSAGILTAACALLMMRSAQPPTPVDISNGPGDTGMAATALHPDDVSLKPADAVHSQGPIVFQLVDENGSPAGFGIYYPARQVPIDFSQLSESEQEAALRLIGEDPAEVMTTSI